jgi:EVE domain
MPTRKRPAAEWIFQGSGKHYDLDTTLANSRLVSWRTPRYRDRMAAGDRVWLQVAGPRQPGIYYLGTIATATHEDPDWHDGDSPYARWRTGVRFDYRIDPPLLRPELLAAPPLASFRPFRGFQGSTVPVPADVATALRALAAPRLLALLSQPSIPNGICLLASPR